MGIGLELGLIVVGIFLNGFFAAADIALISARVSRLKAMGATSARVAAALPLKESPEMALVVDEYGTVVGLITIEDIVVDGLAPIDERRTLGVPVEPSPEYTTAAGFVMAALGAVPTAGASVTSGGYRWTVVETAGVRIRKIKITREA